MSPQKPLKQEHGLSSFTDGYGQRWHTTTVAFTGSGCRARCLARGCNWMGQNHLGIPPYTHAAAWYQAQTDGRRHVADENLKALRASREGHEGGL